MIRIQNDFVPDRPVRIFVGVVTVLTVLGLAYFTVMGLLNPAALAPGGDAEAAKTFAGYMSTRNIVMGGAALVLLVMRAWRPLGLVLALNAAVQVLDTVLGLARTDVVATVGPALISAALIAAVAVLYRQPAAITQPTEPIR
jgi:hypothetical protein